MRILSAWLSCSPRLWPAGFFLVFLLVGCGSTSLAPASPTASSTPTLSEMHPVSTGTSRNYLGAVNRTRALLGIVQDGALVRAYVCDGTPSRLATLAEWFTGQVKGSQVQASSQDQQVQLTAQLTDQRASGMLRLAAGRVYSFSLPRVAATAQVGVFEGTALIAGQRYHAGHLLSQRPHSWGYRDRSPAGVSQQSYLGECVIARLDLDPDHALPTKSNQRSREKDYDYY